MSELPMNETEVEEVSRAKRIVPFGATPAEEAQAEEKPSPWLYLSGVGVTLSGLYAVGNGMETPSFLTTTALAALMGYAVSFFFRWKGISIRAIQTPALLALLLLLVMAWTGDSGLSWLFPIEGESDKGRVLQMVFAWFAVLHTFTIAADTGLLFQCVPCMTMIALASTADSDPKIQTAFLVFIASATFLMIHENFLRSRRGKVLGASALRDRRLFGGQIQLAVLCVVSAFLLANIVAVPIQTVGQSLNISQSLIGTQRSQGQAQQSGSTPTVITETQTLDVGGGSSEDSNLVVMRVRSGRTLYWHGKTFDSYDGRAFRDTVGENRPLEREPMPVTSDTLYRNYTAFNAQAESAFLSNLNRYRIPASPLDLAPEEMAGSSEEMQAITLEGGTFNQLYGAASVKEIHSPLSTLEFNTVGSFQVRDLMTIQNQYFVISQVANDDPELLRKADMSKVPDNIKRIYSQVPAMKPEDEARMRSLAAEITQGKTTAYDKMEAIRTYLSTNIKYNLKVEHSPADRDAVLYMIDDVKQGYCTGFAAAMTMLCRFAGLHARIASGFLPGELDGRSSEHIVRARDKHAWTEVYFPGIGWITQDATEGTEDITPKEDEGAGRKGFLKWLMRQGGGAILLAAVFVALLAYVVKTELLPRLKRGQLGQAAGLERHPANAEIAAIYRGTLKAFGKRGMARPSHFTPDEFAQSVQEQTAAQSPALAPALAALTGLYTRFLYGQEIAQQNDVEQARTLAATLREGLKSVKR
jgi:hypothetical protein